MNGQSKTQFLVVLICFLGLLLSGCGATKQPAYQQDSSDQSSRETPGGVGGSGGLLSDCNGVNDDERDFQAEFASYFERGQPVIDLIHMQISSLPREMNTSNQHYIQMFRWGMSEETGQILRNDTPVKFDVIHLNTNEVLNEQPLDVISRPTIQTLISENGLGNKGVNLQNFFEHHRLLLTGMNREYDALLIAFYDNNQGDMPIGTKDVLIPSFSADPNVYAQGHPSNLNQLHPNWEIRDMQLSEESYQNEIYYYCEAFMQ